MACGDFVSTGDGTGIVHIAPAFGADDYELSKQYQLPMLQPVARNGCFTSEVPDYEGMFFKDADKPIMQRLKDEGKPSTVKNSSSKSNMLLTAKTVRSAPTSTP